MSSPDLIRMSGLAAILGSGLIAISDISGSLILDFENFSEVAATGTYAFAAGLLGLLGFLVAFIGTALVSGSFWSQEFVAPAAAEPAPEFLDSEPAWLN